MIALVLSQSWVYQAWVQRLGWTLLHFLWQGTAIVVAYAMLRNLLARSLSARRRYVLACMTLVAMALAPPLTFLLLPNTGADAPVASWTLSATESKQLMPGIVAIWLAGVLAFSVRLFGAWRFTARLRKLSHSAPGEWQQILENIATRVGTASVRLLVSSLVDVPTVIGWLRPAILVPVEFLTGMPVEHIDVLLAHELAHIRRHDYLASILQSIAEAVLFYHPAVWWISEQIRAERELCCDDLAVAAGGDVLIYARALASLEANRPSRLNPALAANGGSLLNRIRRLLEPARPSANNLPAPACAGAMILLWIAGIGVASVHASQTPAPPLPQPPAVNLVPALPPKADNPVVAVASHVRRTLLYDPLLSPQLAQPLSPWRQWLNEEVAYIASDDERRAFAQLTTDEDRAQFVEQFWLRRDPTPGTTRNEFKEEHYRRIAYANEHFASRVPGWKTDRGRIYITLGPPDEIDAHPGGGSPKGIPFEDWRYRYVEGIGKDAVLEFADPSGSGDYQLAADQPYRDRLLRNPVAAGIPTVAILPMRVRVDYLRIAALSAMANITLQFENRDLQFQVMEGVEKSIVNVFGQITTMTRRPVSTFDKRLEIGKNLQQSSVYQESIPLLAGRYRLEITAKDMVGGSLSTYEVALDVPHFDEDKLALSSLVFADTIEKIPTKGVAGGALFAIGDSKVRPRVGSRFTPEEKMGIYLQIYNFRAVGNVAEAVRLDRI